MIMARTIFKTDSRESIKSKIRKFRVNFFPTYRRTGGRICFLSNDWKEVHIKLGLNWTTRNYVGSVFGGCLFGALDPIYMIQLIHILGKEYVVWDKSATIKFIKPVKKTVFARFIITNELINEIRTIIAEKKKFMFDLTVTFQDEKESIYAESVRTIFVAEKSYLENLTKKRRQNKA